MLQQQLELATPATTTSTPTDGNQADQARFSLRVMTPSQFRQAQALVTKYHYLHKPVVSRSRPIGYQVYLEPSGELAGLLMFGRPEATRTGDWFGSLEDVAEGRCEVTRWQVINLARVYFFPDVQPGGRLFSPDCLPGFWDRARLRDKSSPSSLCRQFRSTLVSHSIEAALDRVAVDYLLAYPPVYLEQPYQLEYCLSYSNNILHRGVIYRSAGFEVYRPPTMNAILTTYRKRLRPLTDHERGRVVQASHFNQRARRYRYEREQRELATAATDGSTPGATPPTLLDLFSSYSDMGKVGH